MHANDLNLNQFLAKKFNGYSCMHERGSREVTSTAGIIKFSNSCMHGLDSDD